MSWLDHECETRLMTEDEVFQYFVRLHRCLVVEEEAGSTHPISRNMTVKRWLDAVVWDGQLSPLYYYGLTLNQQFDLNIPGHQWRKILSPSRQRTLGELCRFISTHARVPVLAPLQVLGKSCHQAGAFIAIRSLLSQSGSDASDIAPGTPLHRFQHTSLPLIYGSLVRLRPKLLRHTRLRWQSDALNLGIAGILVYLSIFAAILSVAHSPWWLLVLFALVAAMVLVWRHSTKSRSRPAEVFFGELKTIGDLCRLLAPTRSAQ
jgi:hypothetical protein